MSVSYEKALSIKAKLEAKLDEASARMRSIEGVGSGPLGLTPDHVKASEAFIWARAEYNDALAELRGFNTEFMRVYGKRYREDRVAQRKPA